MDKVTEEVITSLIKRIEALEDKLGKTNLIVSPKKKSDLLATSGQLKYLRALNGEIWDGMTKREAGAEIDRLLKTKNSTEALKKELKNTINMVDEFPRKVHEIIAERKPLTKEEITEIGEENLL